MAAVKDLSIRYQICIDRLLGEVDREHLTKKELKRLIQITGAYSERWKQGLEQILSGGEYKVEYPELQALRGEGKALVTFIAEHKINRKDAEYAYSARIGEVREFLFNYWKEHDPKKFKDIVAKTIEEAIDDPNALDFREHFTKLRKRNPNELSMLGIEPKNYAYGFSYRGTVTTFREACKSVVYDLVKRGVLQFIGNRRYITVNLEYLAR